MINHAAVIGAGVGGTSVAYFLQQNFKNVTIDIYENNNIGGRVNVAAINNQLYETGGSVLHIYNHYMLNFAKLFNLNIKGDSNIKFGLFDGEKIIFECHSWKLINILKILMRYGLDAYYCNKLVNHFLTQFNSVYKYLEKGMYFHTTEEFVTVLGSMFVESVDNSIKWELKKRKINDDLINELVLGTLEINYGQNVNVPAFVGLVSLAGCDSQLWSVIGGNQLIPEKILQSLQITCIYDQVKTIKLLNNKKFHVKTFLKPSPNAVEYDYIILAAPMTTDTSNVTFENFPINTEFHGRFHQTVCSFVEGDLNLSYYGLNNKFKLDIIAHLNNTGVKCISVANSASPKTVKNPKLWKIFSQMPLHSNELNKLFKRAKIIYSRNWLAYPEYGTASWKQPFEIYSGLYYINAIEWLASAMEMSAIAAKNVSNLVYNSWSCKCNQIK